jgi:hypothetical protein
VNDKPKKHRHPAPLKSADGLRNTRYLPAKRVNSQIRAYPTRAVDELTDFCDRVSGFALPGLVNNELWPIFVCKRDDFTPL